MINMSLNIVYQTFWYEIVANFKCLGATATNQSCIRKEMKSRLNWENVCYLSLQSLFSFSHLSKNINIQIYKTTILPIVFYECETWSVTRREEFRLRVSENRVLSRIFRRKREEVQETGEDCILRSFITCTIHQILLEWLNQGVQYFGWKIWRKRQLARPKRGYKIILSLVLGNRMEVVDWLHLARDWYQWWAFVNTVMKLWVPWKAGNFLTVWVTISFWRRTLLCGIS
jgi:hypothetical protein